MARRRRGDDDPGMDSLMDALTNVVGILLLILIVSSLGIQAAVKKVVESLPEVTEEQLESMKQFARWKHIFNLNVGKIFFVICRGFYSVNTLFRV